MLASLAYATEDITSLEKIGSAFHLGRRSVSSSSRVEGPAEDRVPDAAGSTLERRMPLVRSRLRLDHSRRDVAEIARAWVDRCGRVDRLVCDRRSCRRRHR